MVKRKDQTEKENRLLVKIALVDYLDSEAEIASSEVHLKPIESCPVRVFNITSSLESLSSSVFIGWPCLLILPFITWVSSPWITAKLGCLPLISGVFTLRSLRFGIAARCLPLIRMWPLSSGKPRVCSRRWDFLFALHPVHVIINHTASLKYSFPCLVRLQTTFRYPELIARVSGQESTC